MNGYASNTRTRRNLEALRRAGWRVLLTPDNPLPPEELLYAIDNGAWRCRNGDPFPEAAFVRLIARRASYADFVVLPDVVAGGTRSLELSLAWLPRVREHRPRRMLLPVQDGMTLEAVSEVLRQHDDVGIFLGGSTAWKLATMYEWGLLACAARRYYHVGRVNTARRIRLAAEAGANSFDGTSVTMYAESLPLLQAARSQPSLLVPSIRA